MTSTKISSHRVNEIFRDCMLKEEEDDNHCIEVEGVRLVWLHPDRLRSHGEEITDLLDQLPEIFNRSGGGGASFLNAAEDLNGNKWTGDHENIHQLFSLGIGIGRARLIRPRSPDIMSLAGETCYVID